MGDSPQTGSNKIFLFFIKSANYSQCFLNNKMFIFVVGLVREDLDAGKD